jgi:lysophospholipid acyltransferase (LPLAT)-like uncharacterized protein
MSVDPAADAPDRTRSGAPGDGPAITLDWKTRALVTVGAFVIGALARTWRVRSIGREHFDGERRVGRSVIFAFWHGQMLPLVVEHQRPSYMLISDHRDGEIITQIVKRFGVRTIRGSSSRGAARALLQLARTLQEGGDVGITPDGPRGPRHSFAPGTLLLAQRTGAPIIMLSAFASDAWRLNTWDQFEIPKPFARVTIVYDKPLRVAASDERPTTADTKAMQERLDRLQDEVASGAYRAHHR